MPNQSDINEMASFMDVLNERSVAEYQAPEPKAVSNSSEKLDPQALAADVERENIQAMASLLENVGDLLKEEEFVDHIQQAARSAAEDVRADPTLRDSLKTTRTTTGFIYGEWELVERKDMHREGKSYFTIRHTATTEVLAKDLLLREAALSLVKLLNDGRPINSSSCFQALQADMKYKSALFDMANAKRSKNLVNEERYDTAKNKAITAKKEAKTILEGLRTLK